MIAEPHGRPGWLRVAAAALVIGLGIVAVYGSPALASAPPGPASPTPDRIGRYVTDARDDTGLPGLSVVVTRGRDVVYAGGAGHDGRGAPMTARTPMRVASVSKSFTAMAVMTLVDAGRIGLDRPVADQVPGFAMADPRAREITVRQLLNQTSGIADAGLDIPGLHGSASLADYVSRLRTGSLTAAPGSRWQYCNVNYDLAARLVEVASGTAFQDYVRRSVFEPLGMTGTTLDPARADPAPGHDSVFGLWVPRAEPAPAVAFDGSGAVITTAADMGRWLAVQNGDGAPLVTRASLDAMHAPSPVRDYGMGWGGQTGPDGVRVLAHAGNLPTYNAEQAIVPSSGYGVAVMTNGAGMYDDTDDVLNGLVAMSQGLPPVAVGGTRQVVDAVAGAVALLAAAAGVIGVGRARRWARRQAGRASWLIALRLVPPALPVLLFAVYPDLLSLLTNRTVTWDQLFWFSASVDVTLLVAALGGAATLLARVVAVARRVPEPAG